MSGRQILSRGVLFSPFNYFQSFSDFTHALHDQKISQHYSFHKSISEGVNSFGVFNTGLTTDTNHH